MLAYGRQGESLKAENEEARTLLVNGLKDVGEEPAMLKDQPLHLLLEHAETVKSDLDKKLTREEEYRKQISIAKTRWDQATEKFDKVKKEYQDWEASWFDALETAGFSSDSTLQDVEFYLTAIKEIKEKGNEISKIRTTRIETMQRDITRFHENVGKLLEDLKLPQAKRR